MAVGRRKRLAAAALTTTPGTTVYTAPAAPTDGSAAASGYVLVANLSAGAVTVSVDIANIPLMTGFSIAANSQYVLPICVDVMGSESMHASASVGASSVMFSFHGVEAKDS